MYICLECGATFESPSHYREYRGECFGYPSYEECVACPCCGGDFVETYECDSCGKWIDGEYVKVGNDRYCSDCYEICWIDENN